MVVTPLARLRLASKLCGLGAWLVLVTGLMVSICLFSATYTPDPSDASLRPLFTSLALSVFIGVLTFFFFLFLFAVGAFLEYIGTAGPGTQQSGQERKDNDAEIKITSLPEEPGDHEASSLNHPPSHYTG